ncbi:bifunctional phosphoribosyl-AMP cyclohydrolase/phosphoribosyl-ATP diphosphatase HisIE [Chryseobacterium sp. MHB01]|uniref:bifunctional phosphoribosyl-AMP cyclohydrolase/phosphoribosyl-ATP diphosphatase HisIE n=1 Tax=Chryseobacterium sp. MHB01 TaxID=3109433 RepID=UPI002AFF38FF|nr:bifunctional phosphoribosyl-AMP cyclohydrolase/phosphoribosyl-ATP diphosphatase HisIE [Chryseobacterium sp. MHB01]MEA1849289.1 bifunctional phosphoribosyl-AMP cyclohydrolase/phosphoribosyl-ATP diphosphatase HisIE [Chryseobacterium sp. MHB01]
MNINFNKNKDGLVPVVIQDDRTLQVLMLGYMNEEALKKTEKEGIVTFFSRSKDRLWTKGEESGNFLTVKNISVDCDQDAILIKVIPTNVVCHTGSFSCFGEKDSKGFLYELEEKISQRIDEKTEDSYTYAIFKKGINKVAQKVGEEAVEVVIEAKDSNDDLFKNEAADLLYHFLILLKAKNCTLENIEEILNRRNR